MRDLYSQLYERPRRFLEPPPGRLNPDVPVADSRPFGDHPEGLRDAIKIAMSARRIRKQEPQPLTSSPSKVMFRRH